MKKFFTLIAVMSSALLFSAAGAKAQTATLELTMGGNFSTMNMKTPLTNIKFDGIGFRMGVVGDYYIPSVKGLYTSGGLIFSQERLKKELGKSAAVYNPFYLNIPIHVGYKLQLIDEFGYFLEAGPFVGVGMFGKVTAENADKKVSSEDVFKKDNFNRFQAGLGFKTGFLAFDHYKLSIGFDYNFVPVQKFEALGLSTVSKTYNTYISVGYVF